MADAHCDANPTTGGRYRPVLGTLGFVWDREADSVLLVHRTNRADGKHNGLGGKVEPDEDVVTGITRELYEEALIVPTELSLRGTISWPGFEGPGGDDWFGFLFLITGWTGEVPPSNDEGELLWVPRSRLMAWCDPATRAASGLDFHEGDAHFLPLMFDDDPRQFHGLMPWEHGRPTGWSLTRQ